MAIKMEGEGSTTTIPTIHGGSGIPLDYTPFVDPNAITDPYTIAPPMPVVSTTHINPVPRRVPTTIVTPIQDDALAPVVDQTPPTPIVPVIQGEPAPVYEPTMSPAETAQTNLEKAPTAIPEIDKPIVPEVKPVSTVKTTTGTGISTTTGTKTGTGTTGVGTTPTTSATQPWKDYFDKAVNTTFSYDPAADKEYQLASSQVENQVAQMMVGRGGLYSSVANSALANKLMELQVSYQKQAYDKYVAERDYNMKIASFLADRSDTEFDQNLSLSKFKADLEQQQFQNSITTANLRIAQANAAYNKQVAQAKVNQANAENQLAMKSAEFQASQQEYDAMVYKWRKEGGADYEIAQYFNVPLGADVSSQFGNRIEQALYNLESQAQSLANEAKAIGDAETYLQALTGFQEITTDPAVIKQKYAIAYNSAYNDIINMHVNGESYNDLANYVTSNSTIFIEQMGSDNYTKLLSYLQGKID